MNKKDWYIISAVILLIIISFLFGYSQKEYKTIIKIRTDTIIKYNDNKIIFSKDTIYLKAKAVINYDTIYKYDNTVQIETVASIDTTLQSQILVNHFVNNLIDTTYYLNFRNELNLKYRYADSIFLMRSLSKIDTINFFSREIFYKEIYEKPEKWYNSSWFFWSSKAVVFCGGVYVGLSIAK